MRLQRPRLSARALQAVLALAVAVPIAFLTFGVARSQPPALKDKPAAKSAAPSKPVASKKRFIEILRIGPSSAATRAGIQAGIQTARKRLNEGLVPRSSGVHFHNPYSDLGPSPRV